MDLPRNLLDSTMLKGLSRCPRHFYYRFERGWVSESERGAAAAFGIAWHAAMDVVWPVLCNRHQPLEAEPLMAAALSAFSASFEAEGCVRKDGPDWTGETEERQRFYHEGTAEAMLGSYIETYAPILARWELLGVETPFLIPLTESTDPDAPHYFGLIDKVVRTEIGEIVPVDHKTTSAFASAGGFRFDWTDRWSPNGQLTGYGFSVMMQHSRNPPFCLVDAALVHKLHHDRFRQIPITVTPANTELWLEAVRSAFAARRRYQETGEWPALGLLGDACWSPYSCAYKDLCNSAFNHLTAEPPLGYTTKPWKPLLEAKG